MLSGELLTSLSTLGALEAEWDELAVACALPLMAPTLILAWWRHLAPRDAEPRIVAVRDGDRLVGLAPFYVEPHARRGRVDYRLPGIEVRLAPLAAPAREWEVAAAIGRALATADPLPDVIALEGTPHASHWPEALRDGWPGRVRPLMRRYHVQGCPIIDLEGTASLDDWLGRRSSHARERLRRTRKQFAKAGGTVRLATGETLEADVATLMRLHTERWKGLSGESNLVALGERVTRWLHETGSALLDEGRFRLFVLEVDGEPACAHVAFAAGGSMFAFNGGWDERFARLRLTTVSVLAHVEDAIERGDRRIDMGIGDQSYKVRLADGNDPVAWTLLLPARPRMPLTRLRTAPAVARPVLRDAAKRALTQEQVARVRALRSRLTGRAGADPAQPEPDRPPSVEPARSMRS
jgi:CelD/BcsL family acetyltransferase involved in cellulose biosynthesis